MTRNILLTLTVCALIITTACSASRNIYLQSGTGLTMQGEEEHTTLQVDIIDKSTWTFNLGYSDAVLTVDESLEIIKLVSYLKKGTELISENTDAGADEEKTLGVIKGTNGEIYIIYRTDKGGMPSVAFVIMDNSNYPFMMKSVFLNFPKCMLLAQALSEHL